MKTSETVPFNFCYQVISCVILNAFLFLVSGFKFPILNKNNNSHLIGLLLGLNEKGYFKYLKYSTWNYTYQINVKDCYYYHIVVIDMVVI